MLGGRRRGQDGELGALAVDLSGMVGDSGGLVEDSGGLVEDSGGLVGRSLREAITLST